MTSKHIVIILYILEICCSGVIVAVNAISNWENRRLKKSVTWLFGLMLVRLAVKWAYFYVEYYIETWPLSHLINTAMDGTYALSVLLCFVILYRATGCKFRGEKPLAVTAAVLYVLGFEIISFLWVDKASNVHIVFANTTAVVLYFLNETFMISVTLAVCIYYLCKCREITPPRFRWACIGLTANVIWYALYVYAWNISFVWGLDWIRASKPLDGVLLYALLLILGYPLFIPRRQNPAPQPESPGSGQEAVLTTGSEEPEALLDSLGEERGLTPREREILLLLYRGKSYADISQVLVISINTVKRHCSNIYSKLGIKNRSQIAAFLDSQGD